MAMNADVHPQFRVEIGSRVVRFGDSRLPLRFWSHVVVSPYGCWLWQGARGKNGYPNYKCGPGKWLRPYRAAYEAVIGPLVDGLTLDHLCSTPLCVNPAHLEQVTLEENVRRAAAKKTHCAQGHTYDQVNTYRRKDGSRDCRACNAERSRRRWREMATTS